MRELLKDVALKVEDSATNDSFRVMGRGEMHLSILDRDDAPRGL